MYQKSVGQPERDWNLKRVSFWRRRVRRPQLGAATLSEWERWIIINAVVASGGSLRDAAENLKCSERKLQYRMSKYSEDLGSPSHMRS